LEPTKHDVAFFVTLFRMLLDMPWLFALAFVLAVLSAYENIHSATFLPNSAAFRFVAYFSAPNVSRTGNRATLDDLFARNVDGDELNLELLHKYASENHTALSYSRVWEALEAVDGGFDIYTGARWPVGKSAGMRCGTMPASQRDAGRKAGRCFNREHAWQVFENVSELMVNIEIMKRVNCSELLQA